MENFEANLEAAMAISEAEEIAEMHFMRRNFRTLTAYSDSVTVYECRQNCGAKFDGDRPIEVFFRHVRNCPSQF
jgi:hypothetical protein